VPLAESHHVVVDGSNLATEGRTLPSLEQLDEAVRAYAAEDPAASIIVVVDATFEHRVADAEREEVREAMLNGEVISPPAGAIGRGDAFVLRIAERTGATVLSNDSFQEFHGEHPWLFDDGRLIGGKPVRGVGWIFTPRLPIRGPKSRAATAEARTRKDPESAPAKAAELAKAAKQAANKASKSHKSASRRAAPVDTSWPLTPAAPPPGRAKVNPEFSSAVDEAVEEALHPPEPARSGGATKNHAAAKNAAAKKAAPPKSARAKRETTSGKVAVAGGSHPRAQSRAAQGPGRSQKSRSVPPPAVNEPLTFINFVAAFTVGSTIEGEVVSFTSHGAMVDVPLPGGGELHCYIPLTAMGSPPPTKARQVLKKGEVRPFVLAGLDPSRRVAELALPPSAAVVPTHTPAKKALAATRAPEAKAAPSTKKAAAKKAASAAKKATKKGAASAKKAPTKAADSAKKAPKKAAVKKAAEPRQSPATLSPAKKAPAKKAAAKRAPADKAPAKKSAAKKSPAKKAPAKKATRARR
jgi:Zc3h12a-like Ribonuclease NYN domain